MPLDRNKLKFYSWNVWLNENDFSNKEKGNEVRCAYQISLQNCNETHSYFDYQISQKYYLFK